VSGYLTAALDLVCALWLVALTRGWWRLRQLLKEIHQLHQAHDLRRGT
jgi:hypothetical protein